MKKARSSSKSSQGENLQTNHISFAECPSHLSTIQELSFQTELQSRERGLNDSWFKLGEWSHGYEQDKHGVQKTTMRQSLLVPSASFGQLFDHLESIGNTLHSLGKAGGSIAYKAGQQLYQYEPFHRFKLSGLSADCEPVVFVRDTGKKCLFLNPDVVIQTGLTEKAEGSGSWWDQRSSSEVIRHIISQDNIESIQIRSDFLARYLQARQMALLVGHYSHLHLYNPSTDDIKSFEKGDLVLGSPKEHGKALFQNWGLRKDCGEPFLQRRLHLWFVIEPRAINLDDPWAEEPPFNPFTFTLPTRSGPVAPARWSGLRVTDQKKRFKGQTCNFMDIIYFRQEVLIRYETSSDFRVTDNGDVLCGSHWALNRSTFRLGNDLICTAMGDWAEGVPYSEWLHWQMHAVEPPSYEAVEALRGDKSLPDLVNGLSQGFSNLNASFFSFVSAIGGNSGERLWGGSLDGLPARQMKWVYPSNASEDEFLKRATLASTFLIDELSSKAMRGALMKVGAELHLGRDKKPLGSRNLLQRCVFVASVISDLRPSIGDVAALVELTESPTSQNADQDLKSELLQLFQAVRADFSPLAFLYDLRVHGGIAHPPNKAEASAAATRLGLRPSNWTRDDFIKVVSLITASVEKLASRMSDATIALWRNANACLEEEVAPQQS